MNTTHQTLEGKINTMKKYQQFLENIRELAKKERPDVAGSGSRGKSYFSITKMVEMISEALHSVDTNGWFRFYHKNDEQNQNCQYDNQYNCATDCDHVFSPSKKSF